MAALQLKKRENHHQKTNRGELGLPDHISVNSYFLLSEKHNSADNHGNQNAGTVVRVALFRNLKTIRGLPETRKRNPSTARALGDPLLKGLTKQCFLQSLKAHQASTRALGPLGLIMKQFRPLSVHRSLGASCYEEGSLGPIVILKCTKNWQRNMYVCISSPDPIRYTSTQ